METLLFSKNPSTTVFIAIRFIIPIIKITNLSENLLVTTMGFPFFRLYSSVLLSFAYLFIEKSKGEFLLGTKGREAMRKILPTNDLLFRKLFTSEGSEPLLKAFMQDVLYRDFYYLTPLETYRFEEYRQRLNQNKLMPVTKIGVLATTRTGRPAKIELQVQEQFKPPSLLDSLDELWYPLGLRDAITRRKNSSEAIYLISLGNDALFDRFSPAVRYLGLVDLDTYELVEVEEGEELFTLCYFSLKNRNLLKNRPIYYWQQFFRTGEVEDGAPEYLKEAQRLVDFSNLSEEEKTLTLAIEDGLLVRKGRLSNKEQKAEEKGYRNGSELRAREIASNLLASGLLLEKVAEYTDLSLKTVRDLALKRSDDFKK
ncbi:hypothetical protein I588_00220 [Enterococcus pallens ATCC BAA-351]|uniref:Uncharacterized protein n=2 Tax=Enterococcus pallens TaxID=160454 RepID=R2T273_9ENTE|nr:hypothetical protein UAU_02089 [Enterococcus pallens ATCC BAA-351]EOU24233.1 hypothetical protein I588_00220 [Enterococcus pallens ATCC BAA-351]